MQVEGMVEQKVISKGKPLKTVEDTMGLRYEKSIVEDRLLSFKRQ